MDCWSKSHVSVSQAFKLRLRWILTGDVGVDSELEFRI